MEVIVLDNASDDGSVERIRDEFPWVKVIEQRERRGFGANHNRVARAAVGDLLFVLNPDTVIGEGTIDDLVATFQLADTIAVTAGPIQNPDGSVWPNPRPFPTVARSFREALGLHRIGTGFAPPSDVRIFRDGWVSGCAFMIDRSILLAVGGFDERFFLYSEEVDLMRRITQSGWCLAWVPTAAVTHVGGTTEESLEQTEGSLQPPNLRTVTQFERSHVEYMRKHHGRGGELAFRGALGCGAAIRYVLTSLPSVWRKLDAHGDRAATAAYHRRRVSLAFRPQHGQAISDAAAEYNSRRAVGDGNARSTTL